MRTGRITKNCLLQGKKALALWLTVLVCAAMLFGSRTVARAEEEKTEETLLSLLEVSGAAEVEVEKAYSFTVPYKTTVYLALAISDPVDLTFSLLDSKGTEWDGKRILAADWLPYGEGVYCLEFPYENMPTGEYTIKATLHGSSTYGIAVMANKLAPTISQKSITLTEGFKATLEVNNAPSYVTWSSSKKDVATVNSKGVVTGKSAGTTTITAKVDGQKLTCKVKVKENKYTQTKYSMSDVPYGNGELQVYKAVYEKNGDLTLKCRFINNSGYKINALKNVKIVMKDANGKKIGTYSVKTKKMSIAIGTTKDFNVTIKKDKLKNKKADLRNASYTREGSYEYRRYY